MGLVIVLNLERRRSPSTTSTHLKGKMLVKAMMRDRMIGMKVQVLLTPGILCR